MQAEQVIMYSARQWAQSLKKKMSNQFIAYFNKNNLNNLFQ